MEAFKWISNFLLVLFVINTFHTSNATFSFQEMENNSSIVMGNKIHYPGKILEANEGVAIYKSKIAEEAIKVMYPIQADRGDCIENEIHILKNLSPKFQDNLVESGIVKLIDGGKAEWIHGVNEKKLPGHCLVVVYTYGKPLFPVLKRCVQNNDRKMLFWYLSQMTRSLASLQEKGKVYHNNIVPSVFRLTANREVVLENFEISRDFEIPDPRSLVAVRGDDFPAGFKPTMSKRALNAEKQCSECQLYSFELTTYYIFFNKLPWQMDAIDFLWNVNMTEAREITLKLHNIDLEDYFSSRGLWNPIHSEILPVIKNRPNKFSLMSDHFLRIYNECPRSNINYPVVDEEMQQNILEWISGNDTHTVLITKYRIPITRSHVQTLKWDPPVWLNDEIINFYMEMLVERSNSDDSLPKVNCMKTFFYKRLCEAGYDSVKSWTKKTDIFEKDIILVPVHKGNHWVIVVIHKTNKTIKCYDSLGRNNDVVVDKIKDYLQKEHLFRKGEPFDFTGWNTGDAQNIPLQENNSDCGVFVCQYAEFICRDRPIVFSQQFTHYFRKKMIYEICSGRLLN